MISNIETFTDKKALKSLEITVCVYTLRVFYIQRPLCNIKKKNLKTIQKRFTQPPLNGRSDFRLKLRLKTEKR